MSLFRCVLDRIQSERKSMAQQRRWLILLGIRIFMLHDTLCTNRHFIRGVGFYCRDSCMIHGQTDDKNTSFNIWTRLFSCAYPMSNILYYHAICKWSVLVTADAIYYIYKYSALHAMRLCIYGLYIAKSVALRTTY